MSFWRDFISYLREDWPLLILRFVIYVMIAIIISWVINSVNRALALLQRIADALDGGEDDDDGDGEHIPIIPIHHGSSEPIEAMEIKTDIMKSA